MRRVVYCTSGDATKHPKFFANMCNIVGTEETFPIEFDEYVRNTYQKDVSDLDENEFDQYFDEYRQSVESDQDNEVSVVEDEVAECSLDIGLNTDIVMKSDGSWDFEDTSWAECEETSNGEWVASDNRLIATPEQLIDDISALLQLYLPIEEGTFNITGDIHVTYDMSDEDSQFDIAHSEVTNFYLTSANGQGESSDEIEEIS